MDPIIPLYNPPAADTAAPSTGFTAPTAEPIVLIVFPTPVLKPLLSIPFANPPTAPIIAGLEAALLIVLPIPFKILDFSPDFRVASGFWFVENGVI